MNTTEPLHDESLSTNPISAEYNYSVTICYVLLKSSEKKFVVMFKLYQTETSRNF